PYKGAILTQLSNFWFAHFEKLMPTLKHHLVATDLAKFPANLQSYADQLRARAVIGRKSKVMPIECIVRGYITGSGWKDYQKTRTVSGVKLPEGLKQCDKLPAPIFTPTTKAEAGHDMPISFDEACKEVGTELMTKARDLSIELYVKAADYARSRGIIIADTK